MKLGNALLYILVLYYDLGITAIISIVSVESLSILCFFLLISKNFERIFSSPLGKWKQDKPGTLKVFYGYNALRERAAEKIINDSKYLFISSVLIKH